MTLPAPPALKSRHILAATLGNALEFYDFLTFAFFAIQIGHAFFPGQSAYGGLMLSLATFGAGFITRPLGALVLGAYSDRHGRRPAMILCFTLMGGSIIALALVPPYAAIGWFAPVLAVTARLIQGFSLGGEVGANTAFLVEAAAPRRRGLVVSWQGASQFIAATAGSLVGLILTHALPPALFDAYGWRIAFLLGALTLPLGLWLRHGIPETLHRPDPEELKPEVLAPSLSGSRLETARRHWRVLCLGLLVIGAGTIGTYTFIYIVTYAQGTLHMSAASGFGASLVGNGLSIFAPLAGGWLSDRIGRRRVTISANLVFLVLILPVFWAVVATRSPMVLILAIGLLNMVANFPAGVFYAALAESLPRSIRGGGFAIVYSLSVAILGGSTQLVVTWLIHVTGNALAPAWYLVGATAVGLVALLLMRETAPAVLARRVEARAAVA